MKELENLEGLTKSELIKKVKELTGLIQKSSNDVCTISKEIKKVNEKKQQNLSIPLQLYLGEKLELNTDNSYNYGYIALSKIYHELEIDKFLISKFKNRNSKLAVSALTL